MPTDRAAIHQRGVELAMGLFPAPLAHGDGLILDDQRRVAVRVARPQFHTQHVHAYGKHYAYRYKILAWSLGTVKTKPHLWCLVGLDKQEWHAWIVPAAVLKGKTATIVHQRTRPGRSRSRLARYQVV